jgi:hypothetical protein
MAERWFVAIQGKKSGPLTLEKLQSLAQAKALGPRDHVWKMGMPEWIQASQIPGLFGTLPVSQKKDFMPMPRDPFLDTREWYYNNAGNKIGPVTLREVKRFAEESVIYKGTFLWKHGSTAGWLPAHQHPEISLKLSDNPLARSHPIFQVLAKFKTLSHVW